MMHAHSRSLAVLRPAASRITLSSLSRSVIYLFLRLFLLWCSQQSSYIVVDGKASVGCSKCNR